MDDEEYQRLAEEYYERKTKHREEMLPYIAVLFVVGACVMVGYLVFEAIVGWLR